jgi:hypothetical protein
MHPVDIAALLLRVVTLGVTMLAQAGTDLLAPGARDGRVEP